MIQTLVTLGWRDKLNTAMTMLSAVPSDEVLNPGTCLIDIRESQFKTLKYQPDYPRRFDSYGHAMRWCEDYVQWYNHSHHHSSLAGFTPHQVFSREHLEIARVRQSALDDVYARHPERFSKGRPIAKMPPPEVCINPVPADADKITIEKGVNFPTLPRVIEKAT